MRGVTEWNPTVGRQSRSDLLIAPFGSFDEFAVFESGAGADEGDELWRVAGAPA
jgi:hypothetical protein